MRAELLSLHRQLGITTIYVTHDQTEAMTLGDRVVVMNKGIVQQVATPDELYRRPANTFVAGFIGSPAMNFLRGTLRDGGVAVGPEVLALGDEQRRRLAEATGDVVVGVRPEGFTFANGDGGGFDAEVAFVESLGPESLVHFRTDGVEIMQRREQVEAGEEEKTAELGSLLVARFASDIAVRGDERLRLKVAPEKINLFDAATGVALA
jgi:multiple sugar transport system ATP-binding protein